jgi:hypothetical protein
MNKTTPLSLALALGVLSSPAFATHPNEVCHIRVDVSAAMKAAGAAAGPVKVLYAFRTNMTDMNPPAPQLAAPPAEGPWIYEADVHSSLYQRSLTSVKIQSALYKPDGNPEWSIIIERPVANDETKPAVIRCVIYAS